MVISVVDQDVEDHASEEFARVALVAVIFGDADTTENARQSLGFWHRYVGTHPETSGGRRELLGRRDADAIFDRMLREDVAAGLDGAFLSTSAGSSSAVAGLLYGVTSLSPAPAGGKAAIVADLAEWLS